MNSIEKLHEEFLVYLLSERNFSKLSKVNYESDFSNFTEYLKENGMELNERKIISQDIRRYHVWMKEKGYANETIRRRIASLKSFFNYLLEYDHILKSPMVSVHTPKRDESLPKYFTKTQVEQILLTTRKANHKDALRDYIFVSLLARTGIRRSEALGMTFEDIDFRENRVKVRGKGRKERIVPIGQTLCDELHLFYQSRIPLKSKDLFITRTGNRMNSTKAHTIFHRVMKETELEDMGFTLHSFRHAYATMLVNEGVGIQEIQELLGHSNINTTTIYGKMSVKKLEEAVGRLPLP